MEGPSASDDEGWLRLHPMSLAVNLVPMAWRTVRGFWPLLLAVLVTGGGEEGFSGDLGFLALFTVMAASSTVVHYFTLRYRIRDGKLEVRSGLLHRQTRVMDPSRIQNTEIVQNLFHRWAGLVELRLETAGGASTEGLLSALGVEEARRLQAALAHRPVEAAQLEEAAPLCALGPAEIVGYGLSQRRLGTVALLLAVFTELLGNLGPEAVEDVAQAMRPEVMGAAFLLAFAGSWGFSTVSALFTHWRYRLVQHGSTLVTEEGLTTRRRVEIPLRKVQLLRIDEPLLRRLMGFGTLLIETAGLGVRDGQLRQAEGLVPMVPQESLGPLARATAPTAGVDPWAVQLEPAHPRALYRAIMGRILRSLALALLLSIAMFPYGLAAFLFVPVGIPVAWLDWRAQGFLVTPTAIVARRGYFTRQTWVIARDKLQSVHVVQGPLMRWHGLGRLAVRVAGSSVALPDIGIERALALYVDLSPVAPEDLPTDEMPLVPAL